MERAYESFSLCTHGWAGQHQRLRRRCGDRRTSGTCAGVSGSADIQLDRRLYWFQGGGLWPDSNVDNLDTDLFDGDRDGFGDSFNGGLFGVYAGYNWQSGPWVFGAEGDFNGVWNDETFNILGQDVDVGTDYLASLRGRVGYAFDPHPYFCHRRRSLYPVFR